MKTARQPCKDPCRTSLRSGRTGDAGEAVPLRRPCGQDEQFFGRRAEKPRTVRSSKSVNGRARVEGNAGAGDFEIGSNPRANHAMRRLEEYRHLIERAEATAVAHPLLYKIQLSLLATLGIGYVLVLVVVGVGLSLFVSGMLLAAKSFALLKLALLPLAFEIGRASCRERV